MPINRETERGETNISIPRNVYKAIKVDKLNNASGLE